MKTEGFEVESVVVCDDIRQENNGKAILIGVYTGEIVVPILPAFLGLAIWMQASATTSANTLGVRPKLFDKEGKELAGEPIDQIAPMSIAPSDEFTVALARILVNITQPGRLVLEVKYGDLDWQPVISKKITHSPIAAAK